jgi:hypothetical protein
MNWFERIRSELARIYAGEITMESTEAEVHDKLEAIQTATAETTEIETQANAPENKEVNSIEEFEATVLSGTEATASTELLNRITALEASFENLSNSLAGIEAALAQYATTNSVEQVSHALQSQANALADVKASFASEIADIKAGAASTEGLGKGIEIKSNLKPNTNKSQTVIKADWLDTYLGTGTRSDKSAN